MSDIINATSKLNTDEVAQDKPTSEALFSKVGANINALIDREHRIVSQLFTSNGTWTCPAGVTRAIVHGVGGGGGGGGAAGGLTGSNGANGTNTTFNGSVVAEGGYNGYGGLVGSAAPFNAANPGVTFNGSSYGIGGNGGIKSSSSYVGTAGTCGFYGIREFTVVPATGYAVVIGTGGAGGATNTGGGTGGIGGAGTNGACLVTWIEVNDP
jgi:hypothetical protein